MTTEVANQIVAVNWKGVAIATAVIIVTQFLRWFTNYVRSVVGGRRKRNTHMNEWNEICTQIPAASAETPATHSPSDFLPLIAARDLIDQATRPKTASLGALILALFTAFALWLTTFVAMVVGIVVGVAMFWLGQAAHGLLTLVLAGAVTAQLMSVSFLSGEVFSDAAEMRLTLMGRRLLHDDPLLPAVARLRAEWGLLGPTDARAAEAYSVRASGMTGIAAWAGKARQSKLRLAATRRGLDHGASPTFDADEKVELSGAKRISWMRVAGARRILRLSIWLANGADALSPTGSQRTMTQHTHDSSDRLPEDSDNLASGSHAKFETFALMMEPTQPDWNAAATARSKCQCPANASANHHDPPSSAIFASTTSGRAEPASR